MAVSLPSRGRGGLAQPRPQASELDFCREMSRRACLVDSACCSRQEASGVDAASALGVDCCGTPARTSMCRQAMMDTCDDRRPSRQSANGAQARLGRRITLRPDIDRATDPPSSSWIMRHDRIARDGSCLSCCAILICERLKQRPRQTAVAVSARPSDAGVSLRYRGFSARRRVEAWCREPHEKSMEGQKRLSSHDSSPRDFLCRKGLWGA